MTAKLGDVIFIFALWIWMTIAVGPWWVGALIFIVALALNIIETRYRQKHQFDGRAA